MNAILSQEEIDRLAGSISDSLEEETESEDKGVLSQEEISRITESLGVDEDNSQDSEISVETEGTMPAVLSQEEIDKLASPEPETDSTPVDSGGALSQEEIDKMAAMGSGEPETPSSGGALSQEEIDRLSSVGDSGSDEVTDSAVLSQEEIDLLASVDDSSPQETADSGVLSQDEIDRLSAMDEGGASSDSEASTELEVEPAVLSQEEIDKLSGSIEDPVEEPESEPETPAIDSESIEELEESADGDESSREEISGDEPSSGDETAEAVVEEDEEKSGKSKDSEGPAKTSASKKISEKFNYKMAILIGIPLLVVIFGVVLLMKFYFPAEEPVKEVKESGFTSTPVEKPKKSFVTDELQKGVNLLADAISRDGFDGTIQKSEELFYNYKLTHTYNSLQKAFAYDLSASLVLGDLVGKTPDRFSSQSIRRRYVPEIKKHGAEDDLRAEALMLEWGRKIIIELKLKGSNLKLKGS